MVVEEAEPRMIDLVCCRDPTAEQISPSYGLEELRTYHHFLSLCFDCRTVLPCVAENKKTTKLK